MLCCAGCNKNFLIKSLTCTAADLLASLWDPFVSVEQRSREIAGEGRKKGETAGRMKGREAMRGGGRREKEGAIGSGKNERWGRGRGREKERERKRRHYDVRLDFAACLVGTYHVSILFLFVLYVNSSPMGAQGQHQSMADAS